MKKERIEEIKTMKEASKVKTKLKKFKQLTDKEKDELLEVVFKMFGLIQ